MSELVPGMSDPAVRHFLERIAGLGGEAVSGRGLPRRDRRTECVAGYTYIAFVWRPTSRQNAA